MSDRWFAPTVLAGIGSAALTAVATARDWGTATGDSQGVPVVARADGAQTAPLALALALVALAAWGVLLVIRGRPRRLVAALGAASALGVVFVVLAVRDDVRSDAVEAARAAGANSDAVFTSIAPWYWLAVVAATVSCAALARAVLRSPRWPAMGSRYDRPDGGGGEDRRARSEEDIWKALDEGRDPTA